jgi:hypothetical protein
MTSDPSPNGPPRPRKKLVGLRNWFADSGLITTISNNRAEATSKLAKEIPRLCRGGSKSLTFPAVAPQAPIDETSSVSRQAHAQSPIDGRQWESVKHGDESARCYAAFVPRYRGRNCTLSSDANQNRGASGIHEPPSGGPRIGGAPATPIAALSGSQHKALGFAGGYLLDIDARGCRKQSGGATFAALIVGSGPKH